MKLYIKMKNLFLFLSILILLLSTLFLFKFKNEPFGYFLLGFFSTTMIITIQSIISAKVEESRLLIDKLKEIRDMCFDFREFNVFSVDHFACYFEEEYLKYKERLNRIFKLNDEIGNISYLNKKTRKQLKQINEELSQLQLDLHFIFQEFENQTVKMKIIYFMEFYKIVKDFNFRRFKDLISSLGVGIDYREFYRSDYEEEMNNRITNLEYGTSILVYNKTIEQKNALEYDALKNSFEQYIKKK